MIPLCCPQLLATLAQLWLTAAPAPATLRPNWMPYVQVQALTPRTEDIVHQATGRLTYDEDHTQWVASPLSGRVLQVHVQLGDSIVPGQPLVTLASPEATQLWGEAQRAKLAHLTAQRNITRVRALKKDGAISEREVQAAEAELVLAASSAQSAQDHLRALGLTLDAAGHHATLRAHVGGKITARHVAVGQEVRAEGQEPLLVLSNLDSLWLIGDVFEQDLDQVEVGGALQLRVPAYPGQTFTGRVEHIADTVDAQSRTIKVRASVKNPEHKLKPDMFAAVSFAQSAKDTLFVPSAALVSDGDATAVVVVGSQDQLAVRRVVVGPLMESQYRIISGITPGERVVTRGAPFVLQNMRD